MKNRVKKKYEEEVDTFANLLLAFTIIASVGASVVCCILNIRW